MRKLYVDFEKDFEVTSRKDGKFKFDRISCKVNGLLIKLGVTGTAYDGLVNMLKLKKQVEIHTEIRQYLDEKDDIEKDYFAVFVLDADGDEIKLSSDSYGKKKIYGFINKE